MKRFLVLIGMIISLNIYAQDLGRISGNFQIEAQTYSKDSLIGAPEVPEKFRNNSFLNLIYNKGNFEAGVRYEAYLKPILGFDPRYEGQGIPYRYATYRGDKFDITVGNFYEQFGSGLIFRAYEERQLGVDNAVDGVHLKVRPTDEIEITGVLGKQRNFWDIGEGIVRGADISIGLTDLVPGLLSPEYSIFAGGSVISKFESDRDSRYRLPENVLAYSGRLSFSSYSVLLDAEYAYKYNDPNATNEFNYNPGYGYILSGSYFTQGLGISLDMHKIDNMDFRSERNAKGNQLFLNYIPPLTKQHTYRLASIYPHATQFNGEAGVQAEVSFQVPDESLLGGKSGMNVIVNYSRVQNIDTTYINEFEYDSPTFGIGDRLYFQDFNIEVEKRLSKKLKLNLTYLNMVYDKDIMENEGAPKFGKVYTNTAIADLTYKLGNGHAIRLEGQHMWQKQDSALHEPDNFNGNWAMFFVEYTISPNWFFSFFDEYNYGNKYEERQIHYLNASFAYLTGTTRFTLGYGRQRGGIVCIGGVCKPVPASNGIYLSVTSSF